MVKIWRSIENITVTLQILVDEEEAENKILFQHIKIGHATFANNYSERKGFHNKADISAVESVTTAHGVVIQ